MNVDLSGKQMVVDLLLIETEIHLMLRLLLEIGVVG